MVKYKCTYMEVNNDRNSQNFGMLVEHVKKFPTFFEAVDFSRVVANSTINMVGRPVIEEVNMAGHKD
jgi:hypothetical protein